MLKTSFFFCIIISATIANANAIASEMRVGINYVDPYKKSREKNPVLNIEALLQPLKEIFFCPRPHFGASISSRGSTSQFYGGLTWFIPISGDVFIEPSFGGEFHNGQLSRPGNRRKTLGSRLLFRESISLGKQFTHFNASIILDHASNAGLRRPNCGITTIGLRFGYKLN